ncbi:MAG: hypothetical protein MJZ79_04920 [Paludibacteraceae bacterium]|nr:hypothetical protein [Paludibacteraceae bacterium]
MKKLFVTMAAVLMGLVAANAQLIVGGSFGLGGSAGTTTKADGDITGRTPSNFNFSFAPKVGYVLMDGKMEVGGMLVLDYTGTYTYKPVDKKAYKDYREDELSLSINPYVRYYFLQKGCFNLGVQGMLGLGGNFLLPTHYYKVKDYRTSSEAKDMNSDAKDAVKDAEYSNFRYGLFVAPVMAFNLTNHFVMDITLNALGLYLAGEHTAQTVSDVKNTEDTFNGGLIVMNNSDTYFQLGFSYKF